MSQPYDTLEKMFFMSNKLTNWDLYYIQRCFTVMNRIKPSEQILNRISYKMFSII